MAIVTKLDEIRKILGVSTKLEKYLVKYVKCSWYLTKLSYSCIIIASPPPAIPHYPAAPDPQASYPVSLPKWSPMWSECSTIDKVPQSHLPLSSARLGICRHGSLQFNIPLWLPSPPKSTEGKTVALLIHCRTTCKPDNLDPEEDIFQSPFSKVHVKLNLEPQFALPFKHAGKSWSF